MEEGAIVTMIQFYDISISVRVCLVFENRTRFTLVPRNASGVGGVRSNSSSRIITHHTFVGNLISDMSHGYEIRLKWKGDLITNL